MQCCPSRRTQPSLHRRTRLAPIPPVACLASQRRLLLLLFIGIHNAWDAVTYHIFVNKPKHDQAEQSRSVSE